MMEHPLRFNYETLGDNKQPPLLFLHGFMGDISDWKDIIPFLCDDFYCLALDLPGHGKTVSQNSSGINDDYRMEECAGNIMALFDKLKIDKTCLVAYSMGGRLAFYLAVNYPERFEKIVIESATPGLRTQKERTQRVKDDEALAKRLEREPLKQFLQAWYGQRLFDSIDKDSEKFKKLFQRRSSNNPNALSLSLRLMGSGVQPSLWDKLEQITADLLLIAGEKDDKFRQLAHTVAERCHSAQLKIVEKAGHNVHFENKEEYIKQVKLFLKGQTRGKLWSP